MDDILWIDPDDISDQPGDVERMAVQLASYVLYSLTGRKFPGYKETTEWYCSDVSDYSLAVSSLRHYLPQHLSGAKRPAKVIVSGEPIGRTFRR